MSDVKRGRDPVDPAALGAAAVAAVLALTLSPGRYDWLSSAVGVTLLLLVVAYNDPTELRAGGGRLWRTLAFSATAGLVAAMALSGPIQLAVGTPERCHALADDRKDDCAGDAASILIGATWLPATVVIARRLIVGVWMREPSVGRRRARDPGERCR